MLAHDYYPTSLFEPPPPNLMIPELLEQLRASIGSSEDLYRMDEDGVVVPGEWAADVTPDALARSLKEIVSCPPPPLILIHKSQMISDPLIKITHFHSRLISELTVPTLRRTPMRLWRRKNGHPSPTIRISKMWGRGA